MPVELVAIGFICVPRMAHQLDKPIIAFILLMDFVHYLFLNIAPVQPVDLLTAQKSRRINELVSVKDWFA